MLQDRNRPAVSHETEVTTTGDTRRVRGGRLRALLLAACVSLLGGAVWASEGRGVPITKRTPPPQMAIKLVPDDVLHGLLAPNADGKPSLKLEFGAVTIEFRVPREAEGTRDEMVIVLRDGTAEREWRMPMATFRQVDATLVAGIFADGIGSLLPPSGTDRRSTGDLAERIRKLIGQDAWETLEPLGHELATAAQVHAVTHEQIEHGALRLGTRLREVQQGMSREMAYAGKAGECAGAVGGFFALAGAAGLCWTTNGLAAGTLTLACILTTGATVAGAHAVAANCGGANGGGIQCDCTSPPDCMCCDVSPGDECTCWCPGEECCDWESAQESHGTGPVEPRREAR